ncbi:putative inorganic phosphate cotransporter isoform X1 [Ostrinia nubilalis]|uniref:putative inorganic phosphate cotransporter isoform X1 n=2 Tax=Ostrinia nubilalis TaxID=29057 RepID=UPI00308266AD
MTEEGSTVASKRIGYRHVQVFLLFLGMALAFGMRVNMSIAIVDMTAPPSMDWEGYTYLAWPISTQGVVLSSFIVGYVISQAAGYVLASRFGGKLLMTVGVAVSAGLSAFIPLGAYDGGWLLICFCRGIQGLAQGTMIPAVHHLLENWIPEKNRRLMETLIIVCGMQLGAAFQFLKSGFIIVYWGWETTFFINLITGVVWCVIYVIFGSSYAATSRFISEEEKVYIQDHLSQETERKNLKMPWQSLWTSLPVFSLVLACCAQHWGLWTIMTMMPIYLSQAYNVEIDLIGVIIAASYFAMFLMVFPFQCASDCIIKRKHLSATVTRKIFNTIGFVGPAVCLIAMVYIATDLKVTASLLILFMALNAGQYSGFMSSHEEMAPNFSNILKRTTVGFADVVSIFAPLIAGVMLEDHSDLSDWRYVFNLSAALYLTGGVFYIAFGTSMKQIWNEKGSSIVEGGAEENK